MTTESKLLETLKKYKENKVKKHNFTNDMPAARTEIESILQESLVDGTLKNIRYCSTCDMYHA